MSTIDMRTESQQILERIDDRFLAAVHALLKTYDVQEDEVIGFNVITNEPILATEADDTFEAIVEDVKKGNYIDVDDLIAERAKPLTTEESLADLREGLAEYKAGE